MIPLKQRLGEYLTRKYFGSPLFLVGCGRSGTTALAHALNEHPNLYFSANEAPVGRHVGLLAYEYNEGAVHSWYRGSIMLSDCGMRKELNNLFYESVWGEYHGLRRNLGVLKGSLQNLKHVTMWGTKTFPCEDAASGLLWLFPKAKFIYVIRDGMDVVASMSKFGSFSEKTFEERCHFWVTTIERYDYLRSHPEAITIRYEDFLNEPEQTIRSILNHLDRPFNQQVLDFATGTVVHPLDQPTVKSNPREVINARKLPYLDWTTNEKGLFKEICGESMKHVNYEIPF